MCRPHDSRQSQLRILRQNLSAALPMDRFHPVGRHTERGQCCAGPRAETRASLAGLSRPTLLGAPNLPLYINTSIIIYGQGGFWVHESTVDLSLAPQGGGTSRCPVTGWLSKGPGRPADC